MTAATRVYVCQRCPAEFSNPPARVAHMRKDHPGLPTAAPKWLRAGKPRARRPSLKRTSDTWPGKP